MSRIWIKQPQASFDGRQAGNLTGGLVVEGGLIAETLERGGVPAAPVDEVYDASDCVLLPGLINTHHHCYQTLTRAYHGALDKPLFAWLQALYPVWANLNGEMVATATKLAAWSAPVTTRILSAPNSGMTRSMALWNNVRSPIRRRDCFGVAWRLSGQRRVPAPPAMITA